ncbi:cytochrome c-type biogenesis protein [Neobacillus sp. LXY-4]|uniref:cytochrome c-type biogenesis protein n=1 Tax=Neobacillus sp. LXY-4 TaxID=3379826 RepID=UPI003EE348B9
MNKKFSIGLLMILFIFQGTFAVLAADKSSINLKSKEFKAVASQFMCTCGCGQDHYACDMAGCKNTESFKADLVEMMEKGMDKDEIREYYVKALGEEILTSPEKKGFSLTAWVMPFAALGGAGTGIFFVIRKWVKKSESGAEMVADRQENDEVEEEILSSIIDEERKKYL